MPNVFISEDYLIRMINQAIAALLAVLGMKTSGQYLAAQQLIDQTLESVFGLRARLLKELDDEQLKGMLTYQEVLNLQLLMVVADLFKEESELSLALGDPAGAQKDALRALNFYLEVYLDGDEAAPAEKPSPESPLGQKIQGLLQSLKGDASLESLFPRMSETLLYLLFQYDQVNGHYREAEAALAGLEARLGRDASVREEYQDFYRLLLEKSDQELKLGGMERAEILRKLDRL